MPLRSTVIGSFPKPDYIKLPDFSNFKPGSEGFSYEEITRAHNQLRSNENAFSRELEQLLRQATKEIIHLQEDCGVDVITDGEVSRENYIYYFCRRLKGFEFENLKEMNCRDGGWKGWFPNVVSEIQPIGDSPWVCSEWKLSQSYSKKPLKITLPGPMTIIGSVANTYYRDERELAKTLVSILKWEVDGLVEAGCKYIQIDEPVMVRMPDKALEYGIDNLTEIFQGVPKDVEKSVHLCCGYPQYLDQENYCKADNDVYLTLADKLDNAGFDVLSLEDAHRRNDLSLFKHFKKTKIALGSVKIASSRVESVEEIKARLQEVLTVLPTERLVVAPDCGLCFLTTDLAVQKLKNMVEAAKSLP